MLVPAGPRWVLLGSAGLTLALIVLAPRVEFMAAEALGGTGTTLAVWGSETAGQTFQPSHTTLSGITVFLAAPPPPDTPAELVLERASDRRLLRVVRATSRPSAAAWRFDFAPVTQRPPQALRFTLRAPGLPQHSALRVRYDPDDRSYQGGGRFVSGAARGGDLGFSVWARGTIWESWKARLLDGPGAQWFVGIAIATLAALFLLERPTAAASLPARPWWRRPLFWSLAVALTATFPVYDRLSRWAADDGDWPEVVSHLAATRLTIAGGEFPGWNPYICGGAPNLANPQTYFLATALPLAFAVGDVVASKLALTLGLAAGIFGMLSLSRTLGLHGPPAYLTSLIFPLSGFAISHLANGQFLWLTLGWAPFVIDGYLRSLRGGRAGLLVAAGLLSLTFVEGRVYLVAYLALFLTVLALGASLQRRSVRPLLSLVLIGVLVLGLSAWKLLPTLSFLAEAEASLPNTSGLPVAALPGAFLRRDVSPNVLDHFGGQSLPRHEYAAYVGLLPLLLAAVSLRRPLLKRLWPFVITGGVFLFLALQSPSSSPLEHLPLVQELRNPSRMVSMITLVVALLAGFGLAALPELRVARRRCPSTLRWLSLLVVALVAADLLSVSHTQFARLFTLPAATETFPTREFFQTRLPERQPSNGYPTIIAGKGAKNFCPAVLHAYRARPAVVAREDPTYHGEAYALGDARVALRRFRANALDVHVDAPQPDTIVINQTRSRGWSATPFVLSPRSALLAVTVPAGVHDIRFRYRPPWLDVGLAITAATILGLTIAGRRRLG